MKKILTITLLFTFFAQIFAALSFAATPTPTPNQAVTTQIEQQINNLKDKIASKVAQLNLVEKKGIIGTVTDSASTQITIKDKDGNTHFVDVDELTQFDSSSSKNFGISDITKNMTLGILGLYNKDSRRILARFVTVLVNPTVIHGAVAAIDKINYNLTVVQNDGKQIVIEIEDVTKMNAYDKTAGITKSGFSKIQVGERVYAVGYPDKQNNNQLITSRIIVFPNLPINPAIANIVPYVASTTPTPTITTSPTPVK